MSYEELWRPLARIYDAGEAKAIARLVLETRFGLTQADILCGKVTKLSSDDTLSLEKISKRLLSGEPVQYVLGEAYFCGRTFAVGPSVLIPRPETAELCRLIVADARSRGAERFDGLRVLDIGTGSGCIACTLAAELPGAEVTAWDISDEALAVARRNARRMGVQVAFERRDALSLVAMSDQGVWDIIVSNPPYVCEHEAADMDDHVLRHEPALALFVPDDHPLLFYRPVSNYAQSALTSGGRVYFEVNPLFYDQIEEMLLELGFDDVDTLDDPFGKPRFTIGTRYT